MNITKNGVTLYEKNHEKNGLRTFAKYYMDIDIDPEVTTVELLTEPFIAADKDLRNGRVCDIDLRNVQKTFPNVEEIIIGRIVYNLHFFNKMFPNVKRVISQSPYFSSGTCLIRFGKGDKLGDLLNTFCKAPGEEIDLTNVSHIESNAFMDCFSTNITNDEAVKSFDADPLLGYKGLASLNEPYMQIGSIILWINPDMDSIILQDDVKPVHIIDPSIFTRSPHRLKKITIQKWDTLLSLRNACQLHLETLEVMDQGVCTIFGNNYTSDIGEFQNLIIHSPLYKCKDGVLYTADGKLLLRCFPCKTGELIIPDGVEKIDDLAFSICQISAVKCPDSLKSIGYAAFNKCRNLSHVDFGQGISVLGYRNEQIFSGCPALRELTIPASVKVIGKDAFFNCCLEILHLSEGIEYIGSAAFTNSPLKELNLPESLQYIGVNAFLHANKINVKGNMPNGLLGAIIRPSCSRENLEYNDGVCMKELHYKDDIHYLPDILPRDKILSLDQILLHDANSVMSSDILESIPHEDYRQEAYMQMYELTGDEKYLKKLKAESKSILKKYIKYANEEGLVRFLGFGIVPAKNLQSLLQKTQAMGMTVATAYVLNEIKKSGSETKAPNKKAPAFSL